MSDPRVPVPQDQIVARVTQTAMIFNRKDQALKVNRRLRAYSVLSFLRGTELVIEVPTKMTSQSVWELAQRIHRGEA